MTPLKPPRLRPGDLVALVSPASTIADPSRIDRAVRYLESLGYRTKVGRSVLSTLGYLAGTDEERVADLHDAFGDPQVKAILCIRGGYGTPRILSMLKYPLIARNPKIFMGYSDITALALAMWRKTGLVTFHGPMAGVDMADPMDSFTEDLLWRVVTSRQKLGAIRFPDPPGRGLVPGRAVGRLLGGNLALLVSSMGTPYFPDLRGAVLFIEDIGEEPYRVDRMLAQLRNARILSSCAAILGGQFTDCGPKDATKPSLTLEEVFQDAARRTGRPFLGGLPFGHEARKMTIPVGIRARVDTGMGELEYLEAAVR